MAQLIEFIGNHLFLVAAFVGLAIALAIAMFQGSGGISPQQAVLLLNQEEALPVDLRSEAEYRTGHIINAINITQQDVAAGAARLDKYKSRPLLLYCESGVRAGGAVKSLRRLGYAKVHHLRGGLAAWRSEQLPVTKGK